MTEILFYHLEQRPLEQVLPLLLEKSLERGWKVVVEVAEAASLTALDKVLWTYNAESFLPHAVYTADSQNASSDSNQAILLCQGNENPNAAEVRFFVAGAVPDGSEISEANYVRLVFMFDGHDPDAVTRAREAWKALSADHQTTYWQQEPAGHWAKKA